MVGVVEEEEAVQYAQQCLKNARGSEDSGSLSYARQLPGSFQRSAANRAFLGHDER